MSWQVNLAGARSDLERLCRDFDVGLVSVSHVGDDYALKSKLFDGLTDAAEVLAVGERLLGHVRGVCKLSNSPLCSVTAAHVTRTGEDGKRMHYVFASDKIVLRDSVQVVLRSKDGTVHLRPQDVLLAHSVALAEQDEAVERVLRLLDRDEQDWTNLYRMVEVVEEDAGGIQAIVGKGWVTKASLSRFRHTANSRGAVGDRARHGKETTTPPSNPMSFDEARALVYALVRTWLGAKP